MDSKETAAVSRMQTREVTAVDIEAEEPVISDDPRYYATQRILGN